MRPFTFLLRTAAPAALVLSLALAPARPARADDPAPLPTPDTPVPATPDTPAPPTPDDPAPDSPTPDSPPPDSPTPDSPTPPAPDAPVPPTPGTPGHDGTDETAQPSRDAVPAPSAPRVFAKPAEAVLAWITAFERNDDTALTALLGSGGADLVTDGKDARVAEERLRLARLARTAWSFDRTQEAEGILRIEVGTERMPLAIPVVRGEGGWRFDVEAGRTELLARRIGRNELEAIALCRQYVEMQVAYASEDRDGDGVREYAQRVASTPGSQDGLYWETAAVSETGEYPETSPLGLALSTLGDTGSDATPYGGYRWSILTEQGANAPGAAHSYVINDNMIAGFALVAAPAEYRTTGVMTFLVSNHGKVFQKDLGPGTADEVTALKSFDPDSSWTEVTVLDDALLGFASAAGAAIPTSAEGMPNGASDAVPARSADFVPARDAAPTGPCAPRPTGTVRSMPRPSEPFAPTTQPTPPQGNDALPSEPRPSEPAHTGPLPTDATDTAPDTATDTATTADPIGTFEVAYEGGARTELKVTDAESLTWRVLEGADEGTTGTETVDRRQIAPNVWYVSWQQQDGTVVTQIVDLAKMTVVSTRAQNGQRTVLEGKITRKD